MHKKEIISLKNITEEFVADEVRWMTDETRWIVADAPWEELEKPDPGQLRQEMIEIIRTGLDGFVQNRKEIICGNRHIGFVTIYSLDADAFGGNLSDVADQTLLPAVGIEICEPDYWCHGYGTDALKKWVSHIFSEYTHMNEMYLETWSGNQRMIKCAEKCGFSLCKRQVGSHYVEGIAVDTLLFRIKRIEFTLL